MIKVILRSRRDAPEPVPWARLQVGGRSERETRTLHEGRGEGVTCWMNIVQGRARSRGQKVESEFRWHRKEHFVRIPGAGDAGG